MQTARRRAARTHPTPGRGVAVNAGGPSGQRAGGVDGERHTAGFPVGIPAG